MYNKESTQKFATALHTELTAFFDSSFLQGIFLCDFTSRTRSNLRKRDILTKLKKTGNHHMPDK